MMREFGRDEEPRRLSQVPEEPPEEAGLGNGGNGKAETAWLEAGAEDPAFYLKPSDD